MFEPKTLPTETLRRLRLLRLLLRLFSSEVEGKAATAVFPAWFVGALTALFMTRLLAHLEKKGQR
jgi:hypothetical protein